MRQFKTVLKTQKYMSTSHIELHFAKMIILKLMNCRF